MHAYYRQAAEAVRKLPLPGVGRVDEAEPAALTALPSRPVPPADEADANPRGDDRQADDGKPPGATSGGTV
jgi:hypothetical protein